MNVGAICAERIWRRQAFYVAMNDSFGGERRRHVRSAQMAATFKRIFE